MPGQCFAGHEKFDLLWRGKKIAGAAQRRTKAGLLIQGSVQPPTVALARADWELALVAAADVFLPGRAMRFQPDAELLQHAARLAAEKFSQAGHNQKR